MENRLLRWWNNLIGKEIYGYKGFRVEENGNLYSTIGNKAYYYKINEPNIHLGKVKVAVEGLHFSKNLIDCFNFYRPDKNVEYYKVIAKGIVDEYCDKCATSDLYIVEKVSVSEIIDKLITANKLDHLFEYISNKIDNIQISEIEYFISKINPVIFEELLGYELFGLLKDKLYRILNLDIFKMWLACYPNDLEKLIDNFNYTFNDLEIIHIAYSMKREYNLKHCDFLQKMVADDTSKIVLLELYHRNKK